MQHHPFGKAVARRRRGLPGKSGRGTRAVKIRESDDARVPGVGGHDEPAGDYVVLAEQVPEGVCALAAERTPAARRTTGSTPAEPPFSTSGDHVYAPAAERLGPGGDPSRPREGRRAHAIGELVPLGRERPDACVVFDGGHDAVAARHRSARRARRRSARASWREALARPNQSPPGCV